MGKLKQNPSGEAILESDLRITTYTKNQGLWILVATILGSSMAFIDSTAINVALPVIQKEMKANIADIQWIVEAYALFIASLILVGGTLGDYFGRRRMFATGVIIFILSSILCGFAPTTDQLIFFRAIQGVGGALLVPGSLSILNSSFNDGSRGRAIGTWSGFTAFIAGFGPILGGFLVENFSWRWVFFINVPISLIVLLVLFLRVPESKNDDEGLRLDLLGAILTTVGLGGTVFGLIESAVLGFRHPLVIAGLLVGVISMAFFIVVERRSECPMVSFQLFRSRTFSASNIITFLMYSSLSGALFFVPFNLIQVQGYSPTIAGAAFIPFVLLIFFLSRWAGGLVSRFGGKLPLVIGSTFAAIGYALFAIPGIDGSYWLTFFPAIFVLGLGIAVSAAPLTTVAMGSVDVRQSGLASGINNATSRISGLLAIAVMGILILQAFNSGLDRRIEAIEVSTEAVEFLDTQRIKLAAADIPPGLSTEKQFAIKSAISESFVDGFRVIMLFSSGLALASALTALIFIDGTGRKRVKKGSDTF